MAPIKTQSMMPEHVEIGGINVVGFGETSITTIVVHEGTDGAGNEVWVGGLTAFRCFPIRYGGSSALRM